MARRSEATVTKGGQKYNWTVGLGRNPETEIFINNQSYSVPKSDIGALNYEAAQNLMRETVSNGPLTYEQVKDIIKYNDYNWTKTINYDMAFAWYQTMLDENEGSLGYSSAIYQDDSGKPINEPNANYLDQDTGKVSSDYIQSNTTSKQDIYNSMVEEAYQDRLNLMTDVNGTQAQKFRDTMYGAIAEEQAIAEQSLGQAELDAYRMLGQQQLELENTIAEQRKKALVSGTTSAQLAAGQLQNIFAAQSGAAQVAQSLANQRTQLNQTYAEKRTGVETSLYDYINQQQTIAATAGAQNLAALSSYYSYANKNFNDMMGLYNAKQQLGTSAYNQLLKDIGYQEK